MNASTVRRLGFTSWPVLFFSRCSVSLSTTSACVLPYTVTRTRLPVAGSLPRSIVPAYPTWRTLPLCGSRRFHGKIDPVPAAPRFLLIALPSVL